MFGSRRYSECSDVLDGGLGRGRNETTEGRSDRIEVGEDLRAV